MIDITEYLINFVCFTLRSHSNFSLNDGYTFQFFASIFYKFSTENNPLKILLDTAVVPNYLIVYNKHFNPNLYVKIYPICLKNHIMQFFTISKIYMPQKPWHRAMQTLTITKVLPSLKSLVPRIKTKTIPHYESVPLKLFYHVLQ